jgi:hypothetical protein
MTDTMVGSMFTTRRGRTSGAFTVPAPIEAMPELVARAVASLPRMTLVSVEPTGALLRARANWASWGERDELVFTPTGNGTEVRAQARPTIPPTVRDYGQGRRDLEALRDALLAVV